MSAGHVEALRAIRDDDWQETDTGPREIAARALDAEPEPDPWALLDQIHAAMSIPYDWSADTPEAVAEVLTKVGYSFPPEATVAELEDEHGWEIPDEALAPWRPEHRR